MAAFGKISNTRKASCEKDLQNIFDDVIFMLPWTDPVSSITIHDISILCGHRNEIAQDLAYKQGNSLVRWPDSNHNTFPSTAIDAAPYHAQKPHIHWDDIDEMEALKRLVFICAEKRGISIRWGADWDRDGVRVDKDPDERLLDGPHYELMEV